MLPTGVPILRPIRGSSTCQGDLVTVNLVASAYGAARRRRTRKRVERGYLPSPGRHGLEK